MNAVMETVIFYMLVLACVLHFLIKSLISQVRVYAKINFIYLCGSEPEQLLACHIMSPCYVHDNIASNTMTDSPIISLFHYLILIITEIKTKIF